MFYLSYVFLQTAELVLLRSIQMKSMILSPDLILKKAHGPDLISVNMVKLCGQHLYVPLKIIFDNILEIGIF